MPARRRTPNMHEVLLLLSVLWLFLFATGFLLKGINEWIGAPVRFAGNILVKICRGAFQSFTWIASWFRQW